MSNIKSMELLMLLEMYSFPTTITEEKQSNWNPGFF